MSGTETRHNESQTATYPTDPQPEPAKLIIEFSNLGAGSIRTIKKEIKVLVEDYAWRKMISHNIQVKEGK